MVIYYFGLEANYMLTPLCVPDFLLCTVISMYMFSVFYMQLVFFPEWIYGMY